MAWECDPRLNHGYCKTRHRGPQTNKQKHRRGHFDDSRANAEFKESREDWRERGCFMQANHSAMNQGSAGK
jgi:hypothetical protein